jgi:phosphocarrier protein
MTERKPTPGSLREATREVVVKNPLGIHARPAALLVRAASGFRSDITLEKNGQSVSAKSIMGVMSLAGYPGSKMLVRARGPDAEKAVEAVAELFEKRFHE